jgi:serine/threonine protein kinase
VYEVADEEGSIECVKEVRLDDKQAEFIFRKEIELLSKIRSNPHPNIVEYRGSFILQEQKGAINTFKKGYIQMEKGLANLKTYLAERTQPFDEDDVLMFFTSMLEVFAHLQRSEVAHRDIKPSNVLLFSEEPLYFKVCDVGAGTAVGFCDQTKEMTVIGTPYYLSPELYRAYKQTMHLVNYKAYKSDCYSLGLLFLEFCTLRKINDRLNNEREKVQQKIVEIKAMYPNIIGLGKVLRRMLDHEITTRMDFLELQKYISDNNLLRNVPTSPFRESTSQ